MSWLKLAVWSLLGWAELLLRVCLESGLKGSVQASRLPKAILGCIPGCPEGKV